MSGAEGTYAYSNGARSAEGQAQRPRAGGRPRLTIGMPVYNGEQFVEEAIRSHLAQTFTDFELVISDNGSTDGTEAVCRRIAERDPRVRYHRSDQNRGAGWNFNRTLELARGELFKWSAADDVCAETLLERCVAALDARPRAVLAHPRAAVVDESGLVLYPFGAVIALPPWPADARPRVAHLMRELFHSGLMAVTTVHGVIRTDVLRSVRPFGSYFGSDFAVVTELATRGEFYQVPETLAFFRRHVQSSSTYRRRPSARRMQHFFDPGASGRLREEVNLRRRYFEVALAIARGPLGWRDRAALIALEGALLAKRGAWRLRFELGMAGRQEGGAATEPSTHWRSLVKAGRPAEVRPARSPARRQQP